MRICYFDCFSGISGDMTLAALIDAGADLNYVETELKKIDVEPFQLRWETVNKQGITALKVHVETDASGQHQHHHHADDGNGHYAHEHGHHEEHEHGHDHDHEHAHRHHHEHDHDHHHHEHDERHGHGHDHHDHHHEHGHHHHRTYADIVKLIKEAGFDEAVTNMSLAIFKKIGEAEGKIHNMPLDKVHFHEVGAIDSIVDTVGVALALHSLDVDELYASPIPLGSGKVRIDHGVYPVPAPATLEIMKGIPLAQSSLPYELTTPTGAGIVSSLVTKFGTLPHMIVEQIGYGAGTRDLPQQPNVLRVIIGTVNDDAIKSVHSHHVHEHAFEHEHEHPHEHKHANVHI